MSKYKVGDVAALFSKPKEPTTETGKKLQSLFKEIHGRNKSFQSQETNSKWKDKFKATNKEGEDQRISKKNKKRKFSATVDPESNVNDEQNSKKIKSGNSHEVEFKNNKKKSFHDEGNFPRKKKKGSKLNSSNSNSFNEPKVNGNAENGAIISPTAKKVKSVFIKKSKHQTYDANKSIDKSHRKMFKVNSEEIESNDESFKEEIKDFIKSNSKKSKKKNKSNKNSEIEPQQKSEEASWFFDGESSNEQKPETSFKNSENQISDFIRRPKKKNKILNNNFEVGNNEKLNISNEKTFDTDDTLFKSENENYVTRDNKNFKKKISNINKSIQNSPTKSSSKKQPEFVKLLDKSPEDEEQRLSRTLFVGNLPISTRINDLKDLFSPYGEVEHIRFKGLETDKAKIFGENSHKLLNASYAANSVPGFVVFKERECAVKALALCGTVFKKHHITVDFALPAGSMKLYDEKRSIFIGNLPFDVTDESIWDAFSDCGKIEGVRAVRDKTTGIGKGFGYVLFSNAEARKTALSLEGLTIGGRQIRIKAVDCKNKPQKQSNIKDTNTSKRDTFKSRAIKFKKKNESTNTNSRKSINKIMKKQKNIHKKKKIASLLQKSMK